MDTQQVDEPGPGQQASSHLSSEQMNSTLTPWGGSPVGKWLQTPSTHLCSGPQVSPELGSQVPSRQVMQVPQSSGSPMHLPWAQIPVWHASSGSQERPSFAAVLTHSTLSAVCTHR